LKGDKLGLWLVLALSAALQILLAVLAMYRFG
jgi:hypothetical protein